MIFCLILLFLVLDFFRFFDYEDGHEDEEDWFANKLAKCSHRWHVDGV